MRWILFLNLSTIISRSKESSEDGSVPMALSDELDDISIHGIFSVLVSVVIVRVFSSKQDTVLARFAAGGEFPMIGCNSLWNSMLISLGSDGSM
jgi:hypothetical protein